MAKENTKTTEESREVVGQYIRWANRVINALVVDFRAGENVIPENYRMQGVNIVRRENGMVSVGFVFAKEGAWDTVK